MKCKDIKFPEYFKCRLGNGITLIVITDKRFPVITSSFVFKNGSISDSYNKKKLYGLCSFTSELLIKGTDEYTATDIANLVESSGGYIISGCNYDSSYIIFHSLKSNFESIFSLSNNLLRNSIFKEEEIERIRAQKINLIKFNSNYGEYLSRKIFKRKIYGKSLYGIDTEGTLDSLNKITRNDLIKFYENFFLPNNLIVILVGDITPVKALNYTEKYFSDWKPKRVPNFTVYPPNNIKGISIYIVPRKGAIQSNINIGHIGVNKNCSDLIKLKVMNTLLGGSFISRINRNLREFQGCTYNAYSEFNCKKYQGDFYIETSVDNKHTVIAIKEILKELKEIKRKKVSEEELINVKNYIVGNYPLQLETSTDIATKVLQLELYNLKKDYYNTLLSKVCMVNINDIFKVANKYIDTENLVISVVSSEKELKNALEDFGKVEIIQNIENF